MIYIVSEYASQGEIFGKFSITNIHATLLQQNCFKNSLCLFKPFIDNMENFLNVKQLLHIKD